MPAPVTAFNMSNWQEVGTDVQMKGRAEAAQMKTYGIVRVGGKYMSASIHVTFMLVGKGGKMA